MKYAFGILYVRLFAFLLPFVVTGDEHINGVI